MKKLKILMSILLICIFTINHLITCVNASTHTTYKLSGYIDVDFNYTDSNLKAGIKVELLNSGLNCITDANGYFEIDTVSSNSSYYILKISKLKTLTMESSDFNLYSDIQIGTKDSPIKIWAGDIAVKDIRTI
jgi:hypothetical protein